MTQLPRVGAFQGIRARLLIPFTVVSWAACPAWGQCEREWDDRFVPPRFERDTAPVAIFDDGARRMIFLSGGTRAPDNDEPYAPFYWDGREWRESPGGLTVDEPDSLRFVHSPHDPGLAFVQGKGLRIDDRPVAGVAVWDGNSWTPVGSSDDPRLLTSGPASAPDHLTWMDTGVGDWRITHWDGLSARTIAIVDRDAPTAMLWYDRGSGEQLCVFGAFQEFDGKPISYAAQWDGAGWSPMGDGPGLWLRRFAVHDDGSGPSIYAQDSSTDALRRWDGADWTTLQWPGEPSQVVLKGVADFGDGPRLIGSTGEWLYHKHEYWSWHGKGWEQLPFSTDSWAEFTTGSSPDGPVTYAAGNFISIDQVPACRIARWDGDRWEDVGSAQTGKGISRAAAALPVGPEGGPLLGNHLYVAANWDDHLLSTGHRRLGALARWDGRRWESLNLDVGYELEQVPAMIVADLGEGPRLFVAGIFDPAKSGFNAVGAFDGSAWTSVGAIDDLRGYLYSAAVFDSGDGQRLYVGGSARTRTDGLVGVARFDGQYWRGVGGAFDGEVSQLMTMDDGAGTRLYAAGYFTRAGDKDIAGLAAWNGSEWAPLGAGLGDGTGGKPPYIHSMGQALLDGRRCLVVAGSFTSEGRPLEFAAWNGDSWIDLSQHFPARVRGIVSRETPHGLRTAVWKSSGAGADSTVAIQEAGVWRTLTSNANDFIRAAAFGDVGGQNSLYLLGTFSRVDGIPSDGLARYGCPHCPADFDVDGDADADDAALFLTAWARGDLGADSNADGYVDTRDVLDFLNLWNAGC